MNKQANEAARVGAISIADYDYPLPQERIATHPLAVRDECLLLVAPGPGREPETRRFTDLPGLLPQGAMLVYNNTRVINARLRLRKPDARGLPTGALIEIFCLEPASPADYAQSFASTRACSWHCLVGNSKRWKEGALTHTFTIPPGTVATLRATRLDKGEGGSTVLFEWDAPAGEDPLTFSDVIAALGEIPIPPYLNRPTQASDSADYQTVYSRIEGSVAAPTAGLHFTPRVLEGIDARGIARREVTLHVGAGTFQPVKSDTIGGHDMHSEFIAVPRALIAELAAWTGPVIAVGTTSVRTLESLYHLGCIAAGGGDPSELPQWYPYSEGHPHMEAGVALGALLEHLDTRGLDTLVASTRLMIAPGYSYSIVGGMVTNFHQPRSTLLLLVSAFLGDDPATGRPRWRELYDYALGGEYRFLSYGDACLLLGGG